MPLIPPLNHLSIQSSIYPAHYPTSQPASHGIYPKLPANKGAYIGSLNLLEILTESLSG